MYTDDIKVLYKKIEKYKNLRGYNNKLRIIDSNNCLIEIDSSLEFTLKETIDDFYQKKIDKIYDIINKIDECIKPIEIPIDL